MFSLCNTALGNRVGARIQGAGGGRYIEGMAVDTATHQRREVCRVRTNHGLALRREIRGVRANPPFARRRPSYAVPFFVRGAPPFGRPARGLLTKPAASLMMNLNSFITLSWVCITATADVLRRVAFSTT